MSDVGPGQVWGLKGGGMGQQGPVPGCWELWISPCAPGAGTHLQYFLVVLGCIEPAISNYVFNELLVVLCWNKRHFAVIRFSISKLAVWIFIRF